MDSVFFVLEIIGVIAFAISGATVAIKSKMDIFGVTVLGLVTAVGGGIIRDLLLGIAPPTMLLNPLPSIIAITVSVLTFILHNKKLILNKSKWSSLLILSSDAVGLGVFTVMGINTVFSVIQNPNIFICAILGVVTGVGGGVLRDVMSNNKPYIFVKHFYACASLSGALVYFLIYPFINKVLSALICIILITTLRILAARFHWELPKSNYSET